MVERSVVSVLLALIRVERDKIGAAPYDGCLRTLVEGIKPFVVRLGVKWPRAWLPHLRFSCSRFLIWFSICSLLVDGSLVLVGLRGFWSGCAHVLIPVFDEACDGSSSNKFSSSVLIGYGRVVVLVSLTTTSSIWFSLTSQCYIGLLKSFCCGVRRGAIIFKRRSSERPKLLGFRLSVELGSSFCGKRMVRTWLSLPTAVVVVVSAFPVDT
ncbi:hypothetical protein Bca4012_077089 [Brassica carinata]